MGAAMCRVSRDDDATGGEAVAAAERPRPPQFPPFLLGALYGFWEGDIHFVPAPPRYRAVDAATVAGVVSSSQDAIGRFFRLGGNGGGLEGYEPVSSRGGLVVVRRAREGYCGGPRPRSGNAPSDLCVCDPVAGRRFVLPRPAIYDESHVLLFSGGGGVHPPRMIIHVVNLELLRHKVLQVQTFSPETNAWGPVVPTYAPLPPSSFIRPAPLVIGAAAYWLLGLAVARQHEITIWTLSPSARWTRRAVVDMAREMAKSAAPEEPPLTADDEVRLECFAERSGALLFRLYHGSLFELSLVTMEVRFIGYYSMRDSSSMCAYDYDMDAALLNQ
ncbi:hypothetical protein E2562_001949 [Oryza meyeriana var. granulata]|uniref:DUF7595 domain-containing protein n=1 Tax=Oryza meyeriana var. granulata TaxID=110450 RepID=A0A6G1C3D4_9ORYZ|nr:hypothetical protein E2562_001949 [Oryza meyeriana var. granulata]